MSFNISVDSAHSFVNFVDLWDVGEVKLRYSFSYDVLTVIAFIC
jgi:hypothetical protein